jgi:hypothetical protein
MNSCGQRFHLRGCVPVLGRIRDITYARLVAADLRHYDGSSAAVAGKLDFRPWLTIVQSLTGLPDKVRH